MSFIYENKNLIEALVKAGLDFENKFNKNAQAPTSPAAPPIQDWQTHINEIAKKLVEHRLREVDQRSAETASHISSDNEVSLTMPNLVNLGTLTRFLQQNNIKYDGQTIAYKYNPENQEITKLNDAGNAAFISATTGEQANFEKLEESFVANRTLLENYLKHLRQKSQGTPVFKVAVRKMIEQFKARFPNSTIQDIKRSEPGQPADLADNVDLDNLVKIMTINAGNPQLKGPVVLTAKDIRTDTSLNAWLSDNQIEWKTAGPNAAGTNDSGIETSYVFGDVKNYDRCGIVHVLYTRAKYLVGSATTQEQKTNYIYYMNQILQTGRQMTGPDGKLCPVTTAPGAVPAQAAQSGQSGQQGKPGQAGTEKDAKLNDFINNAQHYLPFEDGAIDFERIKIFLKKLIELNDDPDFLSTVSNITNKINTYVGEVNNMLKSPSTRFTLTYDSDTIASRLKPNVSPVQLIRSLQTIIDLAKQAVDLMKSKLSRQIAGRPAGASFFNAITEHIGYGSDSGTGGYAGNNLADIKRLITNLPAVFQGALK